jgi:hypothetical protein
MSNASPRRNAGPLAELESSGQDGGYAPQSSATEQIGEVGRFDCVLARIPGGGRNRESGGERPRGAHAETLTDRKFVAERDL